MLVYLTNSCSNLLVLFFMQWNSLFAEKQKLFRSCFLRLNAAGLFITTIKIVECRNGHNYLVNPH